jgi:LysM repeat protein
MLPPLKNLCNYNLPMRRIYFTFTMLVLTACAAQQNPIGIPEAPLTPYVTSTASPVQPAGTAQTPEGLVAAETPLPSPTPFTYTIRSGDTISSIALKFGVSMEDLQAANPEISPNAMSIGQVINIPSNPDNPSGEPTPTPVPFTVQQIGCHPTADQGMWCSVLVHNDFPDPLENVTAQITLVDASNATLASQTALLPLNILPPNASLPLTVYFPPEIPNHAKPLVQILTAIRLAPGDDRYLPATVNNTLVRVNADGRSARVNGQVFLPAGSGNASEVWVAAVAYDESGNVIGVRRWEWEDGLASGGNLPFEFMLSGIGGKISSVAFAVEARP